MAALGGGAMHGHVEELKPRPSTLLIQINNCKVDRHANLRPTPRAHALIIVPAAFIKQLIATVNDTRYGQQGMVWILWFLTWGPLKYPIEHRDRIRIAHEPHQPMTL